MKYFLPQAGKYALALYIVLVTLQSLAGPVPAITLPLVAGFCNGERIFYINTEASDAVAAATSNTTLVPKLKHALAAGATADSYQITHFNQPNILNSAPYPLGPANANRDYSPLWRIHLVTWLPGFSPRQLTREDELLAEQVAGHLTIEQTNNVVNGTVVFTPNGGPLPSALEVDVAGGTITLPFTKGFAHGNVIFYINTDSSDAGVAAQDGANFVPRLASAHASGVATNIYLFADKINPAQRNVMGSAPNPVGPYNQDADYSPLWDVMLTSFADQTSSYYPLIRDEAEIYPLIKEETSDPTIIVNLPILRVAGK